MKLSIPCGVVIVVFLVFAVVIFPFLSRTDRGRRRTPCVFNLKQLGLAVLEYTQDYDNKLPQPRTDGLGWASALLPYVKQPYLYHCPQDRAGKTTISYAMNESLSGSKLAPRSSTAMTSIASPGVTVLLFETTGISFDCHAAASGSGLQSVARSAIGNGMANSLQRDGVARNLTSGGEAIAYSTGDIGSRGCIAPACEPCRHGAEAYYLTADGHVALLPAARVSSGDTPTHSGPQSGTLATGTAASSDTLAGNGRYTLTFSAR